MPRASWAQLNKRRRRESIGHRAACPGFGKPIFPNLSEIAGVRITHGTTPGRSGLSLWSEGLHETGDERQAGQPRVGSSSKGLRLRIVARERTGFWRRRADGEVQPPRD